MNVDNSNESPNLNQTEVKSEYFSYRTGMDESLSDFQEKKKSYSGPKTTESAKAKPKKQIKRIKGQKDIRTVLKSKKNELVAYAKDFDKICKQSGLDVDSEQLQIAIALSKSLQQTENLEGNTPQISKAINSQERIGKIRTTLQEYGFTVPEIKITEPKHRKLKRSKRKYKLLLSTESEKQQIISDRYSQVLIQNLHCTKQVDFTEISTPFCYKIATGIAYEDLRDDNTFYIEELIVRNPNSVGSLLKDWSEIPGRPSSPKIELSEVKFYEINCNQVELDCVLSGSLKVSQELIRNKHNLLINDNAVNIAKDSPKTLKVSDILNNNRIQPAKMHVDTITLDDCEEQSSNKQLKPQETRKGSEIEVIKNDTPHQVRSCSPDIFDDEISIIQDNSCSNKIIISQKSHKDSTNTNLDVMDLTECAQLTSQNHLNVEDCVKEKPSFQISQEKTKRKSNDFMELTSVVGSSQPLKLNTIEENIDLTQNSDHEDDFTYEKKDLKQKSIERDLTQASNSSDELPFVQITGMQASDDTVISDIYCEINKMTRNSSPVIDYLANSTKPSEKIDIAKELEEITPRRATLPENVNSSNTTHLLTDRSSTSSKSYNADAEIHSITLNSSSDTIENESIQSKKSPFKVNIEEDFQQSKSQSFFEEFIHPHSDESSKETEDLICDIHYEVSSKSNIDVDKDDKIDLTQSSDNSLVLVNVSDEENETVRTKINKISYEISGLGKKDNVSIDYDELLGDIGTKNSTVSHYKEVNASTSIVYEINVENISATENYTKESELSSSQTSEVFEISDKELDYSMHKSRFEIDNPCGNFDFGGISVVDNLPDLPSIRQSRNHEQSSNQDLNLLEDDSFLPMIDVGGSKNKIEEKGPNCSPCGIEASSPLKPNLNQVLNIGTPTSGDYVVKTDQVTPILDYATMTTPERNMELDKYGLKPFKRKRAIQLLTYIYNQTHPVIEACTSGEIHSQSKKAKYDHETEPEASPQKTQRSPIKHHRWPKKIAVENLQKCQNSPRKIESPRQNVEVDKENDIYKETNLPAIRDNKCVEEDWVFQKREKAKVHSCRVPLHIAFHNYVSSRRGLREAILRYEPVNIDYIHKGLAANGHKYDPKDLLKFMDKKCITVKTADSAKNSRKHY